MARKSLVKDIKHIFENDSTTTKYCDEKIQCVQDKQMDEHRNNRKLRTSKSNEPSFKYSSKEQSYKSNYKRNASNCGSLKAKIDKFNTESTTSRTSISSVTMKDTQNNNIPNRRSSKHTDFAPTVKNNQSNENPKIKIGKVGTNNFERISNDFQSTQLTPKINNEKYGGSTKKETEILISSNLMKQVNVESADKLNDKVNINKKVPVIPAKPKYINKIKPNPNMTSTVKNDLLDKIKIFNDMARNEPKREKSSSSNVVNENLKINSVKKPMPPPKRISMNKSVRPTSATNSDESPYDVVQIFSSESKKNLKTEPKTSSEKNLQIARNKPSRAIKPIPKRNSDDLYDVVQNSKSDFRNLLKSNSDKNLYDVVEKSNLSITNRNAKMIQGNSLDVLESDGYVVVQDSNVSGEEYVNYGNMGSDSSSEDEMATEYDVIENLNVTKITVERRYKLPDNNKADSTFNVKRETYYDHNLNPRIERISRHTQKHQDTSESNNVKKSLLIIQELLQTELAYFKGLLKVYEDYVVYFKETPQVCTPNIWKVFGNFEDIYKRQIEFYGELTECNNNVDTIAKAFLQNESLFNLYESYIINRHTSAKYSLGECLSVIQARDKELGNKLNLDCYLLTPFQRLLRYRLLLKNLKEALEKEGTPSSMLDEAVNYLENIIAGTNIHAKVIQGIQNSPIDLSEKGKLLMIDDCFVRNNGKKYRSALILFEDIILFTRKTESETYIYKNSINLSDLYIRSIAEDLTSFQLQNFPEFRLTHDNKYVFDIEVSDPKVKQEWVKKMESLLWNQFAAHKRS